MKVRQIFDISVNLNAYRNIQFSIKGYFYIRILIYSQHLPHASSVYANPILKCANQQKNSNFNQNQTDIELRYCYTNYFYVSFNDQKIKLNDGFNFQILLESSQKSNIFVKFDLFFAELPKLPISQHSKFAKQNFTSVGSKIIKLNLQQGFGIQFYGDLIFDSEDNFSVLQFGIQSRFLKYQLVEHENCVNPLLQQLIYFTKNQDLVYQESIGNCLFEEFKTFSQIDFYEKFVVNQIQNFNELLDKYHILEQKYSSRLKISDQITILTQSINQTQKSQNSNDIGQQQYIDQNVYDRYNAITIQQLYYRIFAHSIQISKKIIQIWKSYINLHLLTINKRFHKLKYNHSIQRFYSLRNKYIHNRNTNQQQQQQQQSKVISMDIKYPTIFCDKYIENYSINQGEVLNILVHGFQGSQSDFHNMKNYLKVIHPNSINLLCRTLQNQTQLDIDFLGLKFAKEVQIYLKQTCHKFKRINFLGFSLGGIIIRAGIKHLSKYKSKFNLLVTFGTPHLGISEIKNPLIRAGVWYLINFDKIKSIEQLALKDKQKALLRLSQQDSLKWLHKVIVVSSKQDFIPQYSSRIEEIQNGKEINQIHKILKNINSRAKQIIRVDVQFNLNCSKIHKFFGKSHIEFLESNGFAELFFEIFKSFF